jgi:hypothetical protein
MNDSNSAVAGGMGVDAMEDGIILENHEFCEERHKRPRGSIDWEVDCSGSLFQQAIVDFS